MRRGGAAAAIVIAAACGRGDGDVRIPDARRCAIDAPPPASLVVDGTRIRDGHGRTVVLRGVNAGGRSKFAPYAPFDYEDGGYLAALATYLDRAASWGIDVLRVPMSWQAAEPAPGELDEAYLARYDALLDAAWARGMWTIVDFHQDVYAEPLCGDGFPSWTLDDPGPPRRDCEHWFTRYDDADVRAAFDRLWADERGVRTAFVEMWRRTALRHRDRPGVIGYEIINEPHPGSANRVDWGRTTLTDFYSELGAVIAEIDGDALVLVDTTGLEGVLGRTALRRPAGDRIVLAPHSYDPSALFGGDVDPRVEERLSVWADLGADWDVPVLFGEIGIPVAHPAAAVHLRRHLDALDALGVHGTWWEYSQAVETWNFEEFSIVDADGAETALVVELARPYARALAGDRVSSSYDPEARRFTLDYTPAAGVVPTELAAPSRWGALRIGADGGCVDVRAGTVLVSADDGAERVRVSIEPAGG
jgi:endoglycosylceramidase